jgi:hypothetical protein
MIWRATLRSAGGAPQGYKNLPAGVNQTADTVSAK